MSNVMDMSTAATPCPLVIARTVNSSWPPGQIHSGSPSVDKGSITMSTTRSCGGNSCGLPGSGSLPLAIVSVAHMVAAAIAPAVIMGSHHFRAGMTVYHGASSLSASSRLVRMGVVPSLIAAVPIRES